MKKSFKQFNMIREADLTDKESNWWCADQMKSQAGDAPIR